MRSENGFTLVEIVVVTAIIAILGALGAATVPPLLESLQLQAATTALSGAIRDAQQHAVSEGRLWRVLFAPDRRSFQLQYSTSSAATSDCSSSGWADYGSPSSFPGSVSMTTASLNCLSFAASGRTDWPNPVILPIPGNSTPPLVDGQEISTSELNAWSNPGEVTSDNRVKAFSAPALAQFTVDMMEGRPLTSVCLGVFSWPLGGSGGFKFPSTMKVEVTSVVDANGDPTGWTQLSSGSTGLVNPPNNQRKRDCKKVDINGSYRFIRLTFGYATPTRWVVLDEFSVTDLQFKLSAKRTARLLTVKPVTGRVVVQSVSP